MTRAAEFYEFMVKREQVRLNKEAGKPWPWTDDKILQEYKFTNVKRAHDRTTRWLWSQWLEPHADERLAEQLFNCAFFRYFGTIEWAEAAGWQKLHQFAKPSQRIQLAVLARDRLKAGQRVFTGAYVITNQGIKAPKEEVVLREFLWPFAQECERLVKLARETKSWKAVALEMKKIQGFGGTGFMTKEVLQDAIHTPVLFDCTDRNSWCPVGPGARRGLNRVYGRDVDAHVPEFQFLEEMKSLFFERVEFWPEAYVELELHDIQFQLCEFDKYERVRLGQGRPRSRYHVR